MKVTKRIIHHQPDTQNHWRNFHMQNQFRMLTTNKSRLEQFWQSKDLQMCCHCRRDQSG